MISKKFSSKAEFYAKVLDAARSLGECVSSTLGPKGRNVIIKSKDGSPMITKDGVTVAEFFELEDPILNTVVSIIKQASRRTNLEAGDGTTTSTVLVAALVEEAIQMITSKRCSSPIFIKRGLEKSYKVLSKHIEEMSRPILNIEDIRNIATISANNDPSVGEMLSEAVDKVGKEGSIIVEEGRSNETVLDLVEGFSFDSGFVANAFITNERKSTLHHEECMFLITDHKIDKVEQILPALELAARASKPLIIVAEQVEGQALASLIMNTMRGSLKVAAIKPPRYGEERENILNDLALFTGAKFFQKGLGHDLSDISVDDFGFAESFEGGRYLSTVIDGAGSVEKIQARIDSLKKEIIDAPSAFEAEKIQERITRLASGVAIVKVGGSTEVEVTERKHRIEDALEAIRSAQAEGVLPGGGTAMFRLSEACLRDLEEVLVGEEQVCIDIVQNTLKSPLLTLCANAHVDYDNVVSGLREMRDENQGFNFMTNRHEDLFESGVIDPAKVVRCSIKNALSVVATLIMTETAIVEH